MQLSETIKLYMTKEQKSLVVMTMNEYINTVNSLVSAASNGTSISKYTTADVKASLPSALTNQCIRDARSIVNRYNKDCRKFSAKNKKTANTGVDPDADYNEDEEDYLSSIPEDDEDYEIPDIDEDDETSDEEDDEE